LRCSTTRVHQPLDWKTPAARLIQTNVLLFLEAGAAPAEGLSGGGLSSMSMKWMEKKGKRLLGGAFQALTPSRPLNPDDSDWNRVKRVLLIRQDRRIGDLVMNAPLFHGVRRRFPKAYIALLLRRGYEGLFVDDPHISELISFSPKRDFYNPIGLAALVALFRRGCFDLAVDCSNFRSFSLTNGILTVLTGAPLRLGFEDKESPAFLNVLVPSAQQKHYAVNQTELLVPMGVVDPPAEPVLHFSERQLRRGQEILASACTGDASDTAVLFLGASNELKRWGWGSFLQVAEKLTDSGLNVVFAASPEDRKLHDRSFSSVSEKFPFLPPMPLGDFAATVKAGGLFISGDTGPMHIAAACGVPTVSVFLEDNLARYGYDDGTRRVSIRVHDGAQGAKDVVTAAMKLFKENRRPESAASQESQE
jgi:ADP-heptose:LPS heptosyltransferase